MGLKNYFAPAKAKKAEAEKEKAKQSAAITMVEPVFSPTGFETPASPGSRPESVFRNSNMAELHDLKCDVMVNYLHQQQQERLWTMHGEDEGVVLKKSRGEYTCCPADLADVQDGLLKAIEVLNVRVRFILKASLDVRPLTKSLGCRYRQHKGHQALSPQQPQLLRTSRERSSSPSSPRHFLPPSLPEASLCRLH